jgi:hypothetical protein
MMVRYGALLVLTVLLRVTGSLMLLGGLAALILGFVDIIRHDLNYADQAAMLGWFKFTLGVVSAITGFGMLVYGQVLLLMITVENNTRPIKELAEVMKRIVREGLPITRPDTLTELVRSAATIHGVDTGQTSS